MGIFHSALNKKPSYKNLNNSKISIALFGLDNAGKTTTAKGLLGEPTNEVAPTIGFSSYDLKIDKKTHVTLIDVGGGANIRGIWKDYFSEIYGFIFLIDACDRNRFEESRDVLHDLIKQPTVSGKPILILANKQDLEESMEKEEMINKLNIEEVVDRYESPCLLECCSATINKKGQIDGNISISFNWLIEKINNNWNELRKRVEKDCEEERKKREKEKKERKERVEKLRKIREEKEKKNEINKNIDEDEEEKRRKEKEEEEEKKKFLSNPFVPIETHLNAIQNNNNNNKTKTENRRLKRNRISPGP